MTNEELLELAGNLVDAAKQAGADDAEAAVAWEHLVETRIENNDIHTVSSSEEAVLGLRVLVGKSLGFVTSNDIDPASLAATAEEAVAHARMTPPDDLNEFPEPSAIDPVAGLHDPAVARLDAEYTTERAAKLIDQIRSIDERVRIDSGSVDAGESAVALFSSKGVAAAERSTNISGYAFGMAVDGGDIASFDYDGENSRQFAGFDEALGVACDRFAGSCLAGLGAGAGKSYKGPVILAPECVAEFVLPTLIGALSAAAVRKGRSPLAGHLGKAVAADLLTVVDDGSRPGGVASSAFDREGIAVKRHEIVASGVLANYLYNHYEARAESPERASTGHAVGGASTLPSIGPHSLEIMAGSTPLAGMTDPGETILWMNRYSGSTNPVTGDFSGVAKNAFLVSGNERRPVKEVLIQGNAFQMLHAISRVSQERRTLNGSTLVPALRVEDISVTAG